MAAATLPLPEPDALPRVLIVDDSAVARAVFARLIDTDGRFAVAGAVPHADAALALLRTTRVDVILLDLEMPGVDGLTALPDLMQAGRGARVLIVSSAADRGAAVTIQALALGAADTLVKPASGAPMSRFGEALLEKIARLAVDHGEAAAGPLLPPQPAGDDYDAVVIGASTGGIHALAQLLRAIPASFSPPLLITQHLPASFTPHFAAQVAMLAGRPCDVAIDRLRLRPGRVTIAPGDAHIRCVNLADGSVAVRLSTDPASSGCMPSVDPMLESAAAAYGPRLLAVVLSGMGRDGARGAAAVAEAGGTVVVQDRASSTVWGMPGAAAPVASAALDPEAIGRLIASRRRPV